MHNILSALTRCETEQAHIAPAPQPRVMKFSDRRDKDGKLASQSENGEPD